MENKAAADSICSLNSPKVRAVLDRLQGEANRQVGGLARLLALALVDAVLRRRTSPAEEARRLKHMYIPTSRKQGTFLYLTARSMAARRIVEFGTSFAVSTIYLAAAVWDNGGGQVIGSELEPSKAAKARENIAEARLGDLVEIRQGDAQETLRNPAGTVDMVFLDGHKDLYLSILKMLAPHLRKRGRGCCRQYLYLQARPCSLRHLYQRHAQRLQLGGPPPPRRNRVFGQTVSGGA